MSIASGAQTPTPEGERETAVDNDGWEYDVMTGEVLGYVGEEYIPSNWEVNSIDAANAALKLRAQIEGRIADIESRKRALLANLETQRLAQIRRLSWWTWRFESGLIGYARSLLHGRERTAVFDWGRVSFRSTKGSASITDDEAAIRYVETWAPSLVAVKKSVTISAVRAARKEAEAATDEPEGSLPFLAESGPGETVKVTTGVDTGEA